jgi:hypothetical protein
MRFEMKKFGLILNSRPAGREAVLRVRQIANGIKNDKIEFDFSGVDVLTPSFADEFFNGIHAAYDGNGVTIGVVGYSENSVVEDVLKQSKLI